MRHSRRVSTSVIGGLRPNVQITASLRLVRPLAVGGMGSVWIAHHQGLRTDVVVKFILADLADDPEVLSRFQREATAAAEVKSPHVVQIFDHGVTTKGLPYIAMELLEGEDLNARLERERVLLPGEVAGIVLQVSRALTRAHEKKIIHRDIKPENIFLCETGEEDAFVKVLDFGIAKVSNLEQQHTATGEMVGSPLWMSPEQVMGLKSIDYRSDLFSLGIVAFCALTGRLPFVGLSIGALSVATCSGELPVPSKVNPALSPEIDRWFATACAREVGDRFQSARAMADALVAAVGGPAMARVRSKDAPSMGSLPTRAMTRPSTPPAPTIEAPPTVPSTNESVRKPGKRRWLVAGASVVVLLIVVVVWASSRGREAPIIEQPSEPEPASAAVSSADAAPQDAQPDVKPHVPAKPKPKPTSAPKIKKAPK